MIFICLYVFLARGAGEVYKKGKGTLCDAYLSQRSSNGVQIVMTYEISALCN